MKTQQLSKISLILSIIIGFGASVSAAQIQNSTDGIMELPTFYIYASDEKAGQEFASTEAVPWTFEKSLDLDAERVAVEVLLPTEELVQVDTPAIVSELIES